MTSAPIAAAVPVDHVSAFNKDFLMIIDLFSKNCSVMPWIVIKFKELKSKTLKSMGIIDHYCIDRLYEDILHKRDKILAEDVKYFLSEPCGKFIFSMSQKYNEPYDKSMQIVEYLRSIYVSKFSDADKDLMTTIMKRMLGHSATHKLSKSKKR